MKYLTQISCCHKFLLKIKVKNLESRWWPFQRRPNQKFLIKDIFLVIHCRNQDGYRSRDGRVIRLEYMLLLWILISMTTYFTTSKTISLAPPSALSILRYEVSKLLQWSNFYKNCWIVVENITTFIPLTIRINKKYTFIHLELSYEVKGHNFASTGVKNSKMLRLCA